MGDGGHVKNIPVAGPYPDFEVVYYCDGQSVDDFLFDRSDDGEVMTTHGHPVSANQVRPLLFSKPVSAPSLRTSSRSSIEANDFDTADFSGGRSVRPNCG
jgi:hypothetical protein